MPRIDPTTGKQPSGAANRRRRAATIASLRGAQPIPPTFNVGPPPADPLGFQVWGCRMLAMLAWMNATFPDAVNKVQHDLIRNHLAAMGLLFPRAALVLRLQEQLRRDGGRLESNDSAEVYRLH